MTPRADTLHCNGLQLRLWDHGGDGPPVLFLHGYLDTGRSYDAVVARLGTEVRALVLDFRGHGQSEWVGAGGSYHLLDHLKDVAEATRGLAARGLAPAAFVAHSMGGNVALLYAGAYPERVPRLLLLDSLGPPAESPEAQPARLRHVLEGLGPKAPNRSFRSREEAIARLRAHNPGLSRLGAARMAQHALVEDQGAPGAWRFAFDPRLKGPTPVRWPEAMWRTLCGRIHARTHVLRAEFGDVPLDDTFAGRLAALPRGQLSTVAGAMHHVHVEAPDAVVEALRALLDGEA